MVIRISWDKWYLKLKIEFLNHKINAFFLFCMMLIFLCLLGIVKETILITKIIILGAIIFAYINFIIEYDRMIKVREELLK